MEKVFKKELLGISLYRPYFNYNIQFSLVEEEKENTMHISLKPLSQKKEPFSEIKKFIKALMPECKIESIFAL